MDKWTTVLVDRRVARTVEHLLQDLRHAARALRREDLGPGLGLRAGTLGRAGNSSNPGCANMSLFPERRVAFASPALSRTRAQ